MRENETIYSIDTLIRPDMIDLLKENRAESLENQMKSSRETCTN